MTQMPHSRPVLSAEKMNQSVLSTAYTTHPVWFKIIAAKGIGLNSCKIEVDPAFANPTLPIGAPAAGLRSETYPDPVILSYRENFFQRDGTADDG